MGLGPSPPAVGVLVTACAVPILLRHPRHVLGWIIAVTGVVWACDGLAESWTAYGLARTPDLPLTGFALWFVAQLGAVLLLCLPSLLVLYPTGRLMPGRWGKVSVVVLVMACALPLALVLAPASVLDGPGRHRHARDARPGRRRYKVVLRVAQLVTFASLPLAVAVVVARQRRAVGRERVQMRWLAWAAVVCLLVGVLSLVVRDGWLLTARDHGRARGDRRVGGHRHPGAGDHRCRRADGRHPGLRRRRGLRGRARRRAGRLLGATLGDRLTERDVTLLVLLVAVAAYGPLRAWLGGLIRRVLVGRRGDRYDVVAGLAARLEESADVHRQLPALAATVATTFKLGYVQVEVFGHAGGTLSASYGTEPATVREVPIRYGSEQVGRLVLPDRGLRSMLSNRDQELLFDVVRQAAMAVRSARLAAELQASRERLVLDREDDRRRIRRDLHDGLGPVLGGVAMRLDAAGNAMERDPETARRMLAQSRQDVTDALADVRRLVHGLRPPALDDLGLTAAIDQQVERMRSAALDIRVDAADLPALPAAVEVAAYRIVSEALANMSRHARATTLHGPAAGEPGCAARSRSATTASGSRRTSSPASGSARCGTGPPSSAGPSRSTCPADGGTVVRAWLPFSNDERETTHERRGTVSVLIADDHPVFRDGLASLLSTQPGVEVVATAAEVPRR